MDANQNNDPTKKTYPKKATGKALQTAERHSQDHELKLFGSSFWYVVVLEFLVAAAGNEHAV